MMQNHTGPNLGERAYPVALAGQRSPESKSDKKHALERDGWWRVVSATFSYLRFLQSRLEQAGETISAQRTRIEELEALVMIDDLTGLMNRRGFNDAFNREMDRVSRNMGHGGLLIMIDLDNFKIINDTYGHAAGDAALRLVGKTLLHSSRKMDVCARMGGDEFILLLANCERDKALVRAQNLIKQLNHLSLVWYGAEIPVRASLGLKEYDANDTPENILGDADSLLYTQKRKNKGFGERISIAG